MPDPAPLSARSPATLTVCIPTHDGRGPMLAEAIDSVLAQCTPALAGRVELAIADNASRDSTRDVVAAARERGVPIAYQRHPENLGVSRNIRACVALAGTDWCWLLSSDDALEPGAIAHVLALVEAHPDAVGVTAGQAVFDAALTRLAPTQAAAMPALDRTTVLRGPGAVVSELGWAMSGLSSQIVRRDAWERAAARVLTRPGADDFVFPHVAVMLAMVVASPAWIWCPEKLVRVRADNVSIVPGGRWEARLMRELDAHWGAAVGHGPGRHRARRRVLDTFRERSTFTALRRLPGATTADDLALLRAFVPIHGGRPAAWPALAPLLVPRPLLGRAAGRPLPPLAPADRDVAVRVTLPAALRAADERMLRCTIENRGSATLSSAGAQPVAIAARWTHTGDGETHDGLRAVLTRPLRPGRSRTLHCSVVAPLREGVWELRVGALQEHVAWFEAGAAVGRVEVRR